MERIYRRAFVIGAGLAAITPRPTHAQARCGITEPDIEGPYYRPGAPLRSDLTTPDLEGRRLTVRGLVRGRDCAPLAGALLDVWQADAQGHYDNDGSGAHPPGSLVLRGRLRTDDRGRYELRTLLPGHYLDGRTYRPAHIHVKVAAASHEALTTQLYFAGDPYNEGDRWFRPSRLLRPEPERGELAAPFDFTLGG